MSSYDTYIFILCLVVFVLLVCFLGYLICCLAKLTIKLIKAGLMDNEIRQEINKEKKKNRFVKILDTVFSIIFCVFMITVFIFSLCMKQNEDAFGDIPTARVVKTDSMAKKNEQNTYLFENGLDNQLQVFDIIFIHKKPAEQDLKLYDIVVYSQDEYLIVHRIVGIEEPNEMHPDQRHFLLQGDAISSPDKYPVLYSQIKGIYKGDKLSFVGSFVLFMQSPAGWLCILLVIFSMFASPLLERRLKKEKRTRYFELESLTAENRSLPEEQEKEPEILMHSGGKNDV